MIDEKKLIEEITEYTRTVYGCNLDDICEYQEANGENPSTYIVQGIAEVYATILDKPKVGE